MPARGDPALSSASCPGVLARRRPAPRVGAAPDRPRLSPRPCGAWTRPVSARLRPPDIRPESPGSVPRYLPAATVHAGCSGRHYVRRAPCRPRRSEPFPVRGPGPPAAAQPPPRPRSIRGQKSAPSPGRALARELRALVSGRFGAWNQRLRLGPRESERSPHYSYAAASRPMSAAQSRPAERAQSRHRPANAAHHRSCAS